MAEIKTLTKKRASMKAKLTQFSSYLSLSRSCEKLSDLQLTEIEYRLSTFETLYEKYDALQNELESLVDDPAEQYAEREDFERMYYSLVASARQLSSKTRKLLSQPEDNESQVGSCNHTQINNSIRLPKIDLPKFSGSYHNWLEFRDTFLSIIHNNNNIDKINKLHYLRASLKGSALLVIDNLDFKSDNYDSAWKLLCERFDNKRLLVNNHVQALFKVEPLYKESSRGIRHIIDITNKNLRALATLDQPVQYWDTLIIYMMSTKLDSVSNRDWEQHRNNLVEPPTLTIFTNFLSNKADLLETLEESKVKAIVNVVDGRGKLHRARVLLDSGSTANFISEEFSRKLSLNFSNYQSNVTGLNNQSCTISKSASLTLRSLNVDYEFNIKCLVLPKVNSSIPSTLINVNELNLPDGIRLADPLFNSPASIDILVGAEIFWEIVGANRLKLGKNKPTMIESKLGWIISGAIEPTQTMPSTYTGMFAYESDNQEIDLTRFWQLDSISSKHKLTAEERACEQLFTETTSRNSEGRFTVQIPLKDDPSMLGDSYNRAKQRFLSLETRLNKNPTLNKMYSDFMAEYIELGHMSLNEHPSKYSDTTCFLPHHGVLKESSTSTKLRVVFDASAITTSGKSFNDIQMIGPTIQDDLLSILIRFRQHKIVVVADIEKFYRCTLVDKKQRPLQQILWRKHPNEPLKSYTLNTLTYGTASAPYLATRCLLQLAYECSDPRLRFTISRDFYVDDYLSGGSSVNEVLNQCREVVSILQSAKYKLRKWQSSSMELLQALCGSSNAGDYVNFSENELSKTLGLNWHCSRDTFKFTINIPIDQTITKRKILSVIAQIFDPLGLVTPSIVEAKLIMQQLWLSKCSWDEPVPDGTLHAWQSFQNTLPCLNKIGIPRWVTCDTALNLQLHVFTDASEKAYGACIYIRSSLADGSHVTHLVTSKSKVSPIKATTIPRLELCAALLGTRLFEKVSQSLTLTFNDCIFWSDSTIVLGWLASSPMHLKPFIRHRVIEIQDTVGKYKWRYTPSHENPADLASRGLPADKLCEAKLWWSGPDFLNHDDSSWPKFPKALTTSNHLPETIKSFIVDEQSCTNQNSIKNIILKCSNFQKLQRIIAYVLRLKNICKGIKVQGPLTPNELTNALHTLMKISQQDSFSEECRLLKQGKSLPPKNKYLSLSPFLDEHGVIRVGGRLNNSFYDFDVKHPILICSSHHITTILFRMIHNKLFHAGPQLLLATIRQQYWPIGGRNLARKITQKCVRCCRVKANTIQPIMGNLPEQRVQLEFPFLDSGVDYAGPIMIADRKGRGCKLIKSFICVFVCLATRAVHLELVSDMTKEAFLASLNRFIARRGKPRTIFSDNGTTFIGAFNELARLLSQDLELQSADPAIKFSFIPAYTPHFGGLWESAVKSVKYHLRRILGLTHLTFEEMATCLSQIEAILNSRPLVPISSDPNDLVPLTPAHFLIGRSLVTLPSEKLVNDINISSLQRFNRIDYLKQHFWKRFSKEYIMWLQERTKWRHSTGTLIEGTLVLIKESNTLPLLWPLGRIQRVIAGRDGVGRVADIYTRKGVVRRAFNTIVPLPVSIEDQGSSTAGVCLNYDERTERAV